MRNSEPVTITHPDVTRFFMTIEEAVGLVLEAARLAEGGETFVLDMGEPVRIVDLVANYARQMRHGDVEMRFTGLRPGEKLHEALFSESEECLPTSHPRIFSTHSPECGEEFADLLADLFEASRTNSRNDVRAYLEKLLRSYTAAKPTSVLDASPYPDDY
jgi:FlaA1/EpsC-like NDP-sugar epimerase